MNKQVVRIVLPDGVHDLDPQTRTLLVLMGQSSILQIHRDDVDGMCFDLLPPAGVNSRDWADDTAAEFSGYRYNAVRAPECPADSPEIPLQPAQAARE